MKSNLVIALLISAIQAQEELQEQQNLFQVPKSGAPRPLTYSQAFEMADHQATLARMETPHAHTEQPHARADAKMTQEYLETPHAHFLPVH